MQELPLARSPRSLSNSTLCLSLLALFISSPQLHAEDMPPLDGVYMQNMMMKMNQMQSCLSAIEPEKFHQAEQAMYQAQSQITALCQKQESESAQRKALQFLEYIQHSDILQKIDLCNQPMSGFMPAIPLIGLATENLSTQNICTTLGIKVKSSIPPTPSVN